MLSSHFKAGDIIGFSGDSLVGDIINVATYGVPRWGLCHVGIVAHYQGRPLVFESTMQGKLPCAVSGRQIDGTQAHALDELMATRGGKVWHYPLYRPLYHDEDRRLTDFLLGSIEMPYDMVGAFRSAGVGLSWIESLLRDQDLTAIFCSEWVAAAYCFVGLHPTDNVSRWNPNRLCRHLRRAQLLRKARRLK